MALPELEYFDCEQLAAEISPSGLGSGDVGGEEEQFVIGCSVWVAEDGDLIDVEVAQYCGYGFGGRRGGGESGPFPAIVKLGELAGCADFLDDGDY